MVVFTENPLYCRVCGKYPSQLGRSKHDYCVEKNSLAQQNSFKTEWWGFLEGALFPSPVLLGAILDVGH